MVINSSDWLGVIPCMYLIDLYINENLLEPVCGLCQQIIFVLLCSFVCATTHGKKRNRYISVARFSFFKKISWFVDRMIFTLRFVHVPLSEKNVARIGNQTHDVRMPQHAQQTIAFFLYLTFLKLALHLHYVYLYFLLKKIHCK